MIVKGRYVGQIEYNFMVDLDRYGINFDEFRENMKGLNKRIQLELGVIFNNSLDGVKDDLIVTQQYLDVHEVEGEQP